MPRWSNCRELKQETRPKEQKDHCYLMYRTRTERRNETLEQNWNKITWNENESEWNNGFSRKIGCNRTLAFFVSGPELTPNGPQTHAERTLNGPRTDPERILNGPRTDPDQTPNGPRCYEIFSEKQLL